MVNKIFIIGNLVKDPQVKYFESGSTVASFTIATNTSFIDREGNRQERTEWIRVVCFNKIAENCGRYLHQGSLVFIEGNLQTRKWLDQQGQNQFVTEVRAQKVTFLDRKPEASQYHYNGVDVSHGKYPLEPHSQTPQMNNDYNQNGYSPKDPSQIPYNNPDLNNQYPDAPNLDFDSQNSFTPKYQGVEL